MNCRGLHFVSPLRRVHRCFGPTCFGPMLRDLPVRLGSAIQCASTPRPATDRPGGRSSRKHTMARRDRSARCDDGRSGHRRRPGGDLGGACRGRGGCPGHSGRQGLCRHQRRHRALQYRHLVAAAGRRGATPRSRRASRCTGGLADPDWVASHARHGVGQAAQPGGLGLSVPARRQRRAVSRQFARPRLHALHAPPRAAGRGQDLRPSSGARIAQRRRGGRRRGRRRSPARPAVARARRRRGSRHRRLRLRRADAGGRGADRRRLSDGGGSRRRDVRHGVLGAIRLRAEAERANKGLPFRWASFTPRGRHADRHPGQRPLHASVAEALLEGPVFAQYDKARPEQRGWLRQASRTASCRSTAASSIRSPSAGR